ncbi:YolD-like family protein [Bacillus tianshenii]|nr:YolD-like family protein [Bacillus tianshenii]
MIKDRGTIKWTAMMLPEHVEMIKEIWREDEKKPKPILDEQELQELNETIEQALQEESTIHLTYFEAGDYKLITGKICRVNVHQKTLLVEDAFDNRTSFSFTNIIHATLA